MRHPFFLLLMAATAVAGELRFRFHAIDWEPIRNASFEGDYGLTALADIDQDGDLDFVVGGRIPPPERLYWLEFQAPDKWVRHPIGTDYESDVGLAALDVDGDTWIDLVCSGVWFRNPGNARDGGWERLVFAEDAGGAHDIVAADVDGDGRDDIVMMGDARTSLNALCWFKIPTDPRAPWQRHDIAPGIHGAIAPAGVGDLNGDGHADVVRGDTWYENKGGKGLEWIAHPTIPMGRKGPYGMCVRTVIADIDGNGKPALVMCDADIIDSKVVILRNPDGKGETWLKQELPQSFRYGSLHSLAVADFNGDGRLDIVSNEQEELLPARRRDPRWIVWENLGEQRFVERIIRDDGLGGHELQAGDVDGDGDIDLVSKPWASLPWNSAKGRMHLEFLENLTH
ncbi:MAG TPA: VCBS repeat-containing protein [Opitutaceae bacterium]